MNNRTLRTALLGAIAAGLCLSQQACANPAPGPGSSPSPVAAEPTAGTSSSPDTDTSGGGTGDEGTGDDSTGSKNPCTSDGVSVEVTLQDPEADELMGLVALTNKTDAPCLVEGRASISLRNAAGETVEVPTDEVDEPGPATAITLKPGTTAFQGIKWIPCDKGPASCPTGNSLSYNLEASTDGPYAKLSGFPNGEASDLTMKSLMIGTLQPSTQGVVAW